MKKLKLTPFVCCAPLAILLFLLYRYYCVSWTPGALFVIGSFILNISILVLIDRFLVLWIKQKYLWGIEIVIILLLILLKAWKSFLLWPAIELRPIG